ncbi:MAG TPA: hypothetical protein VFS60_03730 [Thermoanaerobaculia bacterium]|nr:hypothetical protein [Thermoanaerobaculia bacterium]
MIDLTLSDWKDLASIVGAAIALLALIKGVFEYSAQGAQKRADLFFAMREKLKENETYREIFALLEDDSPKLLEVAYKDRRDLLGVFEELALLLNSGLITEAVAHYMFGYYAIACWDSTNFWADMTRDSPYWSAFRDLVTRMQQREGVFFYDRRHIRF